MVTAWGYGQGYWGSTEWEGQDARFAYVNWKQEKYPCGIGVAEATMDFVTEGEGLGGESAKAIDASG